MRAKFYVETVADHASGANSVLLQPVLQNSEENKTFWQATPGGKLEMYITNPNAKSFFEAGKEYYIDITPVIPCGDSTK
ncbi:hypothetical protein NIES4103_27360 [Nostoc sp. NIES-4103]|nr:hypothetical protein NIES4103_27360 [Nostoc sp. NIES-4103]